MTHLSVVIPVYNESSLIDELVKRVKTNVKLITEDFEIIIVDDGSQDNTWNSIENEAKSENRIKGIKFSRNFGHHYAITAGLHNSIGEWVVVMDGDLQDRPEVIPDLYKKAQEGFDVVFVSRQNRPEKLLPNCAKDFLLDFKITFRTDFDSRQANFSIINKKVVEAFKKFPENARFYGSTIKWLGFNRSLFADHGVRHSGKPSYTIRKRFKLASDIILLFSRRVHIDCFRDSWSLPGRNI
jgi:polyisoprenyl-phosphate glycosyltransferase